MIMTAGVPSADGTGAELIAALQHGKFREARRVLDGAPDLASIANSRCEYGYTPIIWAALMGSLDIVELLLESLADLEACSDGGVTALVGAAEKGHEEIVGLLLENGANPNYQSSSGMGTTALIAASANGYLEIVRLLLENGAAVAIRDREGRSAWDVASSDGVKVVLNEYNRMSVELFRSTGEIETERAVTATRVHSDTSIPGLSRRSNSSAESRSGSAVLRKAASVRSRRLSESSMSGSEGTRHSRSSRGERKSADAWVKSMTELVGVSRTLSAIPGSPAYSTSAMTPVVNPSAHNARSSHYKIGSPMELLSPSCNGTSGHAVVDSVFLYGVWALKQRAGRLKYDKRYFWIELGSGISSSFLCWSKNSTRRMASKRLVIDSNVYIQGPQFESTSEVVASGCLPRLLDGSNLQRPEGGGMALRVLSPSSTSSRGRHPACVTMMFGLSDIKNAYEWKQAILLTSQGGLKKLAAADERDRGVLVV